MSELRKVLQEEYSKKESLMSTDSLIKMIEEMVILGESLPHLREASGAEDESVFTSEAAEVFIRSLDRMVIEMPTEQTGRLNTTERSTFTNFISENVAGKNLAEGIANMNSIVDDYTSGLKINEILGRISTLRIARRMITDYTDSSAGFVFESFLAALYMGRQVTETPGGALPIDDVRLGVSADGEIGHPVSLKLLGPNTQIEGSLKNLLKFYLKPEMVQEAGKKGIEYIIALKNKSDRIEFLSFDLTPLGLGHENFFFWINPLLFDWEGVASKFSELTGSQLQERAERTIQDLDFKGKKALDTVANYENWKEIVRDNIISNFGRPPNDSIFEDPEKIHQISRIIPDILVGGTSDVKKIDIAKQAIEDSGKRWELERNLGATGDFFSKQIDGWSHRTKKTLDISEDDKKAIEAFEESEIWKHLYKDQRSGLEAILDARIELIESESARAKALFDEKEIDHSGLPAVFREVPSADTFTAAGDIDLFLLPQHLKDWPVFGSRAKHLDPAKAIVKDFLQDYMEQNREFSAALKETRDSFLSGLSARALRIVGAFNNRKAFFFDAIKTTGTEFRYSELHVQRVLGRDITSPTFDYGDKEYEAVINRIFNAKEVYLLKSKPGQKHTRAQLDYALGNIRKGREVAIKLTQWLAMQTGTTALQLTEGAPAHSPYEVWALSLLAGADDQFVISQRKVRAHAATYGSIKISEEDIRNAVKHYFGDLKKAVLPVYKYLSDFTRNINEYFLAEGSASSLTRAQNAVSQLKSSVDKAADVPLLKDATVEIPNAGKS